MRIYLTLLFLSIILSGTCQVEEDTVEKHQNLAFAVDNITWKDFNTGNIHGPFEIIQGRMPGIYISRVGSDPNQQYHTRIRGLHTYLNRDEPLLVMEGFIGIPSRAIDPFVIQSLNVVKDGVNSKYGMRGSGGAIDYQLKSGKGPPAISYHTFYAFEKAIHREKPLNGDEFIRLKNNPTDGGERHNWTDEISQTGSAFVHNLIFTGSTENFEYISGINARNIEGIQKGVSSRRRNAFLNLKSSFLNDRLQLNLLGTFGADDAKLGFAEAYRYATTFNPTSPVQNPDGSYYEPILFDYYNPIGLIERNSKTREQQSYVGQAALRYSVGDLWIKGRVGQSGDRRLDLETIRGHLPKQNGNYRYLYLEENIQWETRIGYDKTWGKWDINASMGAINQKLNHEFETLTRTEFERHLVNLMAYDFQSSAYYDEKAQLHFNFRSEGSSALGANNKWGNFFSVGGYYNLGHKVAALSVLSLGASFGIAGMTPYRSGLSQLVIDPDDPDVRPVHNENPDLKWEQNNFTNARLTFRPNSDRWESTITWYRQMANDFIYPFNAEQPEIAPITYSNFGKLRTCGWEIVFNYQVIDRNDLTYSTGLNLTLQRNHYMDLGELDGQYFSSPGSPGFGFSPLQIMKEGEKLGNLDGPVYRGVDTNGNWIFKDPGGGEEPETPENFFVIGNGLPKMILGWSHQAVWKNWSANVFFRGAIGHDAGRMMRLFYQSPSYRDIDHVNVLTSTKDVLNLNEWNRWSSFFVEKASYFTLHNLDIGYRFFDDPEGIIKSLRVYGFANNLFTLTKFKGNDPEYRVSDPVTRNSGLYLGEFNDPFAAGIDRRNTWLPSRSFGFGLNLTL